jgi:hypothetical protein
VLDVALGRLNEIGDQVVAALELHVDLGKGILELVAPAYQAVVYADRPDDDDDDKGQQYVSDHIGLPGEAP